jgi:hypothetical protein
MSKSRRVIVLGGLGQFGRTAAEKLRKLGLAPQTASRGPGAELCLDADDIASIRATVRPADIVVDAAGPFYRRSLALVEAAIEVGFDVIDINDDLSYAERVIALEPKINAAGIRLLTSASSVSAVAAAVVRQSGFQSPTRATAFLAPATRHTANSGAARSLIRSVGRPVRILCDGRLQNRDGWRQRATFPMPNPLGKIHGRLFESADALHLPHIWPTLQEVAMFVDTNTLGVNTLLALASKSVAIRKLMEGRIGLSTRIARLLGSSAGGIGYEIEDASGSMFRYAIVAEKNSFVTAIAPAVLAAQAIADDRFEQCGLVPADHHVDADKLIQYLQSEGITCTAIS